MLAASQIDEIAAYVFLDIAIIVVVARLMGALFRRIRQPAVVGEILAGILLGPTLLGAFPGNLDEELFPLEVRPFLKVIAQLGLVIFMFIVGLELDLKLIRGKERTAAVVSVSSIALPFGLGFLLAAVLYGGHKMVAGEEIEYLSFALFIGASMSITAFPVLARILTERGMYRTAVGTMALACAAVDDIIAWSLLAFVLAVAGSGGVGDLPRILGLSIVYVAFMFIVVKPQLGRLADRYRLLGRLTPDMLAVLLVGLLLSAWATDKIGIHAIFGAFLWGVIMPRERTAELFYDILERLEYVAVLLLLPVFFIATGLDVNIRGIGLGGLGELGLILLVACVGKFAGASAAARAQGVPARQAAALGILMNTRGLTELVILNVGLSFGILDQELFTLLVVMAIVTTIMTEPLLRLAYPDELLQRDIAEAEQAALGVADAYRVLVAVDDPARAGPAVDVGADLAANDDPAEVVLSRFLRSRGDDRLEVGSGLGIELEEMAASFDTLQELAGRAETRPVRCVVFSQFSTNAAEDLVAQVRSTAADMVVVPWDGLGPELSAVGTRLDALLRHADRDVGALVDAAALEGSGDLPLVVQVREGPHGALALEVAARLARQRRTRLWLDAGPAGDGRRERRRFGALVEDLERAGVAAEIGSEPRRALVVAALADAWATGEGPSLPLGSAGLLVRARPSITPEGAHDRLARLASLPVREPDPPAG